MPVFLEREEMLKTARSKIVFLMVVQLAVLCAVAASFSLASYERNKRQQIRSCNLEVSFFSERLNKSIKRLQENARNLALSGEIFYAAVTGGVRDLSVADLAVRRNFENNPISVGGGIWFEPYKIEKSKKRFCRYAYKDSGAVVIDEDFESDRYDYLTQRWYLTVKEASIKRRGAYWTAPYFDESGSHALMVTVGAGIYDAGGAFVGMSTVDWELDSISQELASLLPTEGSCVLFADARNDFIMLFRDGKVNAPLVGSPLSNISWYSDSLKSGTEIECEGKMYFSFKKELDNGMILIMNVPTSELLGSVVRIQAALLILLFLVCAAITFLVYKSLSKYINKPIALLLEKTAQIGDGNLDVKIAIPEPAEFAVLGDSFNKMTEDIKGHVKRIMEISAERQRMESELEIAKSIQQSTLPKRFSPEERRKEFEIYANMAAAREVGGDFYDFFMLDDNRLVFLIADVSGKGIPAALFMMTTSTLIRNTMRDSARPEELMARINAQVCKTNDQDFFVSVFLCIVDLRTGALCCVNAGHNQPLVMREDGEWKYMECRPSLVVGALEGTAYSSFETSLSPGERIFLYTDGVTEAMNAAGDLFGEQRLKSCLDKLSVAGCPSSEILSKVREDVSAHAAGEPQSDDITMVVFEYVGAGSESGVGES